MPYAAAVTYEPKVVGGIPYLVATVVETGITAATDEFTVEVPKIGTLLLHICTLTAGDGTATTIDPDLFEISSTSATQRRLFNNGAAGASTRGVPTDGRYYTSDGKLRGHSGANGNSGTTGNVTTILVFTGSPNP